MVRRECKTVVLLTQDGCGPRDDMAGKYFGDCESRIVFVHGHCYQYQYIQATAGRTQTKAGHLVIHQHHLIHIYLHSTAASGEILENTWTLFNDVKHTFLNIQELKRIVRKSSCMIVILSTF